MSLKQHEEYVDIIFNKLVEIKDTKWNHNKEFTVQFVEKKKKVNLPGYGVTHIDLVGVLSDSNEKLFNRSCGFRIKGMDTDKIFTEGGSRLRWTDEWKYVKDFIGECNNEKLVPIQIFVNVNKSNFEWYFVQAAELEKFVDKTSSITLVPEMLAHYRRPIPGMMSLFDATVKKERPKTMATLKSVIGQRYSVNIPKSLRNNFKPNDIVLFEQVAEGVLQIKRVWSQEK